MAKYVIAGLKVQMETFGRSASRAEAYLQDFSGEPDIIIESDPEALKQEKPNLTLDDCEYFCTGKSFYNGLMKCGGFLLHSSAVVKDGYAYLFSAPCGTGKSTHARFWLEAFGDSASILNDDKPALRRIDGRWYAFGTPWSGKTNQNLNLQVTLGGICILSRGLENKIEKYGGPKAIYSLLTQTIRPDDSESMDSYMELLDDLMTSVPVWQLSCTKSKDAAIVSYNAMYKEAQNRFGGK